MYFPSSGRGDPQWTNSVTINKSCFGVIETEVTNLDWNHWAAEILGLQGELSNECVFIEHNTFLFLIKVAVVYMLLYNTVRWELLHI